VPEKAMAAYFKAKDFGARTQYEEGIAELICHKSVSKIHTSKRIISRILFCT
jgi:hypothetical protein